MSPAKARKPTLGPEMEREFPITIGIIGAAHGVRGEVRVHLFNKASDTLRAGIEVAIRGEGKERLLRVASVRRASRGTLVSFQGVVDRDAARALTGCGVAVRRGDLPPLGPGEFYYQDVIGLPVRSRNGLEVGRVAAVMSGATEILVIEGPRGEVLVPVVEGFVLCLGPEEVVVEDDALE